ncbi:expressed unknown protein [Seminavis robusta]|uniref:Exostosin GT47 domain-containing protein n=1 Tax=Seminavis robusta TaxID=568900 RepID=A0A9N8EN62_9STRA|nr:expressed unknown protein [Seminavis robusta]|eukprot:Sro1264_g257370.1 n/a (418) ;mRNA; f:22166-23419
MCKETCCVESVAISLEQDEHQIIQQRDGVDLADLVLPHRRLKPEHLKYHGQTLHPAMLPCLVPGTIITLENHRKQTIYFWHKLRQHIQVPYILLTTGSDNDSPECYEQYIADPLLIRWYGTNPINRSHPLFQQNLHKFKSLNLGLSFQRPQERHLLPYLQLNNFTNPFLNKRKWDFSRKDFSFKDDMFVQFGLHTPHRKQLWNLLCPNTTTTSSSCNTNTVSLEVHQLYSDMSQYRFGISPPGHGYDCYRTYEMLLLGVIPIVEKSSTKDLFEDLPVIQMEDLASVSSRQDFVDAIQNYIASDAFQNANFQRGWERLFLKSRRQELLQVSQREKEVLVDQHGMRYYQAYQYTVLGNNHGHLQQLEDCEYGCNVEDEDAITDWVDTPLPKLTEDEINWLQDWERSSQLPQFQFLQSMY